MSDERRVTVVAVEGDLVNMGSIEGHDVPVLSRRTVRAAGDGVKVTWTLTGPDRVPIPGDGFTISIAPLPPKEN